MSQNIHIMSDERMMEDFNTAHNMIKKAKHIYFFGFGYDETNLDRLKIKEALIKQKLLGTAYEINERRRKEIRRYFLTRVIETETRTVRQSTGCDIHLLNENMGIMNILEDVNFAIA